jgi:hypothetical protein
MNDPNEVYFHQTFLFRYTPHLFYLKQYRSLSEIAFKDQIELDCGENDGKA